MKLKRDLRSLREFINFPLWSLSEKKGPDNHYFKKMRIKKIGKEYNCDTLIETGTFYGQTVKFASRYFKRVISIEIFKPLYDYNVEAFKGESNIFLFNGDSSDKMKEMMSKAEGRIIFWLDGHYSGDGTGKGEKVCPVFEELYKIGSDSRRDHCILIDDYRLFGTDPGYPSFEETKEHLLKVNPDYSIEIDHDCIMALPKK
jgi:hypothetical protein